MLATYAAIFGDTPCEVHVESRPVINGPPVWVAMLFVHDYDHHCLREIHTDKDRQYELHRDSAAAALGAAQEWYEKHFGARLDIWQDPTETRQSIAFGSPIKAPAN